MSEYRAGYDVSEVAFIAESVFGTKPTTGAWKPFGVVTAFKPSPNPTIKEKVGLGRQTLSTQQTVKKNFELEIEQELVVESTNPAYHFMERFRYVTTDSAYGNTFALSNRIPSQSIGAKLDLTTDEYFLLTGCKCDRLELRSGGVDSIIKMVEHHQVQNLTLGTTDYVSGSATRNSAVSNALAYIRHADCDLQIDTGGGYTNIYDRINSWTVRVTRDLKKAGSNLADKTLWAAFPEGKTTVEVDLNLDFNSRNEWTQLLADTEFDLKLSVPSGSGGKTVTFTDGKWNRLDSPHSEMDLIDINVSAKFASYAVATL